MLIGLREGIPASAADDRISSNILRIWSNRVINYSAVAVLARPVECSSMQVFIIITSIHSAPWTSRHVLISSLPACTTDSLTAHSIRKLNSGAVKECKTDQDASSLGNAWPPPAVLPWCDKEQAEQPCIVLPQVASRPANQLTR